MYRQVLLLFLPWLATARGLQRSNRTRLAYPPGQQRRNMYMWDPESSVRFVTTSHKIEGGIRQDVFKSYLYEHV